MDYSKRTNVAVTSGRYEKLVEHSNKHKCSMGNLADALIEMLGDERFQEEIAKKLKEVEKLRKEEKRKRTEASRAIRNDPEIMKKVREMLEKC